MKTFFLLMLSVFAFCAADAQVTTSGMNGTVTDADGQPLAGATVIAVHTPSGTQYGAVSDKNGGYNLQGLRTGGPYTVTFSFVGCQSVEFPGLMLSLGQTLKRDAFLKDSQQLEAVVITADGKNSSMNVNRAGAVTSISNEQIELMPTVNRSMNDIMRLTPQASSTTSGLAIGGGNYRQSYVTVDGAAFNNMFGIGGNLAAVILAAFATAAFCFWCARDLFFAPKIEQLHLDRTEIRRYFVSTFWFQMFLLLMANGDVLLIKTFAADPAEVGIYSSGSVISSRVSAASARSFSALIWAMAS